MARRFTHRFNTADGTVDSICHLCFHTVATTFREPDLDASERAHVCDPDDKLRFDVLARAVKLPVRAKLRASRIAARFVSRKSITAK
jgi:hypothetical protein